MNVTIFVVGIAVIMIATNSNKKCNSEIHQKLALVYALLSEKAFF